MTVKITGYIKRLDAIYNAMDAIPPHNIQLRAGVIAQLIKTPAADVRDNVRGEWVLDDTTLKNKRYCSRCSFPLVRGQSMHYCSCCGADMRGEKDG